MQEYGVRAQAGLARQQAGLMNGSTTPPASGGVLRSAASGTNGTIPPVSGTNGAAPARMTPSAPLGAMQSVAAPPTNQAKDDIEKFGLDEAITRYYQRSADADKMRAEKVRATPAPTTGAESPAISAPYQIPDTLAADAALNESAATRERVATRQVGTDTVPDMMNQAVRQAAATAPAAPATVQPVAERPYLRPTGAAFVGNEPKPQNKSLKITMREAEDAKRKRNIAKDDPVPDWLRGTFAGGVLRGLSKEY